MNDFNAPFSAGKVTYTVPDPKRVNEFLKVQKLEATKCAQSTSIKDGLRISGIIQQLHDARQYHTSESKKINEAIFQIYDQAITSPLLLTRQQSVVTFLTGFLRHLPADLETQQEVAKRMAVIPQPETVRNTLETITQNMLDSYLLQKFKKQDKDLQQAYRLQGIISLISENKKHNRTQLQWLHENSLKLAQISPRFKKFTKDFKAPQKKIPLMPKLRETLQEAPLAYGKTSFGEHGIQSRLYDRE